MSEQISEEELEAWEVITGESETYFSTVVARRLIAEVRRQRKEIERLEEQVREWRLTVEDARV